MASPTVKPVLRTDYQRSVADYWNREKDPVNIKLGEVDGLYHHHYGLGAYDPAVLHQGDEVIIAEMHRLETAQAEVLLDAFGDVPAGGHLMDGGSGRGGTSFMANARFGARIDGVSISEQQVAFANNQAVERGVADQVRFHFKNMLDTGFETGSFDGIWTNETTMYVDLQQLYGRSEE